MTLIARAKKAGLDLSISPDGKLVITGPKRAEAVAREVIAHKAAVLEALAPPVAVPSSPADEAWEKLAAMRWGPAVGTKEPGIVVEPDWRWTVANLPHDTWVLWRRIADQLLEDKDRPTEDEVHEADRVAAERIGVKNIT